mmetsp:Transcript_30440/g.78194  ORF Transcript_30440/g.78194 Transcript_30440/m.78194 type:complete len:434 (-) Transcript_30440:583-1884(-)
MAATPNKGKNNNRGRDNETPGDDGREAAHRRLHHPHERLLAKRRAAVRLEVEVLDAGLDPAQLHLDAVHLAGQRLHHLPAVLPQHHVQRLGVLRPGGCTDLVVQRAAPRALQVAADQCLAAEVDLRLETEDAGPKLLALCVVNRLHHGIVLQVRHHPLHLRLAHGAPDQQLPVLLDEEDGDEAQERADRHRAQRVVEGVPRHVRRQRASARNEQPHHRTTVLHHNGDGRRVIAALDKLQEGHAAQRGGLHDVPDGHDEGVALHEEGHRQHREAPAEVLQRVVVHHRVEAVHNGDARAEAKDADRADKGPHKAVARVPVGVQHRRLLQAFHHAHAQQPLVADVRHRMDGLRQHCAAAGRKVDAQLGDEDGEVGSDGDVDGVQCAMVRDGHARGVELARLVHVEGRAVGRGREGGGGRTPVALPLSVAAPVHRPI